MATHQEREHRRKLLRNVRYTLLLLGIAGASVAAVSALRPRPVPVDLATTTRGPLRVAIEESGVTRVKDRFLVSAPVAGNLSRLVLEPGDSVKEGDPLAEIAPALSPLLDARTRSEAEAHLSAALSAQGQAQAQLSRAHTARELAQQELERDRQLAQAGSLASQALDQAEFLARMRADEVSSAEFAGKVAAEEVRVARVTLGQDATAGAHGRHVDVLSPVSGRVLHVHQKSAGVVQASAPLVEVGDPELLEIVVDLLTTDAVHVEPGTPVVINGWGGDHPISGRVRQIEPSAFTRPSALGVDEQRVNVVVTLTEPHERWAALGDGYRVEARLVLWQADNVLQVPQGAVFRHGDGWATFCIDAGMAKLTSVQLGHRGEANVEVLAGLPLGAQVLVHPGDRVKDGARVEAR